MKHELTRCHLRLVRQRAYDPLYAGLGQCVVEDSLEEYSLPERINAPLGREAEAGDPAEPASVASPASLNPLSDEPSEATIRAVQRFGVVGLVTCALGSGVLRWWKSLYH